jgi:hypothetical protein
LCLLEVLKKWCLGRDSSTNLPVNFKKYLFPKMISTKTIRRRFAGALAGENSGERMKTLLLPLKSLTAKALSAPVLPMHFHVTKKGERLVLVSLVFIFVF